MQKKTDAQDLDETRDEEDDDEEDLLRTYSMVMAAALMEHHPDFFMTQCFATYLPVAEQLLQPTANDSDRQLAAQLGANICEHLDERAVSHWPTFVRLIVPQLLENMHAENPDVRGTACYAISMAARSSAFATQAGVAAQRATQVVTEARSRANKKSDKEAQCAADNAVSVMLEILEHHPSAAHGDLWGAWLAGLPCQEDTEEGTRNNKALLRLTRQQIPGLVGEGNCNVPRILELLVNAYKTEMADLETSQGIGQLLLAFGEAGLQQFSANFTPKLKKKVMRVAKDAQKGL